MWGDREYAAPERAVAVVSAPRVKSSRRTAPIQPKLEVGRADDPLEREADAVAEHVVAAMGSESRVQRSGTDVDGPVGATGRPDQGARIRRSTASRLGAFEECSRRGASGAGRAGDADHRLQRAVRGATVGAEGGRLDDETERLLRSTSSGGSPLPTEARSAMESAIGADFSSVRVHAGPISRELNERMQARAFTTGNDIHFRDGVPDVRSDNGRRLLAHELTHTIQQGAATVARTVDEGQAGPEVSVDRSGQMRRSGLGDWVRGLLGWGSGDQGAAAQPDPLETVHREFISRATSLDGVVPQLKGQSLAATAEAIWQAYAGTISGTKGMSKDGAEVDLAAEGLSNKVPESSPGRRDNRATNPSYYDTPAGAPAAEGQSLVVGSYRTNMSESFNVLTTALKGLSQLQFDQHDRFAFWNSPGAKDVAVKAKSAGVLALESSAIGSLFDGFGSYSELAAGLESKSWDPQLWAELSRAYASMVLDAIVKDPSKQIYVVCGLGFNDPSYNIWNSIESLTLKLGADRVKMTEQELSARTTYLGVAGNMSGEAAVIDWTATCCGISGTWVSTSTPSEMVAKQAEQAARTSALDP